MKGLTERQKEVLRYIETYIHEQSFPPSIRNIAEYFQFSPKGAYDHVTALKKKGYLSVVDKQSRSIGILKNDEGSVYRDFSDIPIVGDVAAGRPIMSEENYAGSIRVDTSILKSNERYFALKVKGDSMIGAAIVDDDTVIIEKCNAAKNRDIVVAWVDDKVTLKTFYKENNRIRLQPENPAYEPIYCKNDLRIEGKLICVIRTYK